MTKMLTDTFRSKVFKITMFIVFLISLAIALFFTYVKIEMNGDGEFCAYEVYDNGQSRNITSSEANWKSGGEPCILLFIPVIGNLLSVFFVVFSLFMAISGLLIVLLFNRFEDFHLEQ